MIGTGSPATAVTDRAAPTIDAAPVAHGASRVEVWGSGPAVDAVRQAVGSAQPVATWPDWPAGVVVASGADDEQWWTPLNQAAASGTGPALLLLRQTRTGLEIGPLVEPGRPGCAECLRRRRAAAHLAGTELDQARAARLGEQAAPAVNPAALRAAATLIADELGMTDGQARTRGAVLRLDAATLLVSRHEFLPSPQCPACGALPDDTAAAAVIQLPPTPCYAPGSYRARPLRTQPLLDRYLDEQAGLIAGIDLILSGETPTSIAQVSPLCTDAVQGYGRTLDVSSTVAVSVLEGLERRSGLEPGGKRTVVRASFGELGPDRAVDPQLLGLPDVPPAGSAGLYVRYTPDTEVNWVYGHSFGRGRPVLVPEAYAYYGVHNETRFAYECSNGCALGGSLAEAILHGIFEVAERDAFLATWYAKLPAPRFDPRTATDPTIRLLIDRLRHATGFAMHAFNITMPEGVPAVWVMAVDEDARPDEPRMYCAAGAHLDPESALRSALLECIVGISHLRRDFAEPEVRSRAEAMFADANLVTTMADHSRLYALEEAWPRLDFLYRGERVLTMVEAFPHKHRYRPGGDLADTVRWVVERYLTAGLDVIAVDETTPELRVADLSCVKVIIPGTFSMTFGHHHRRAETLPRLWHAPVRLGYRNEPLRPEEVNRYPHPFP